MRNAVIIALEIYLKFTVSKKKITPKQIFDSIIISNNGVDTIGSSQDISVLLNASNINYINKP